MKTGIGLLLVLGLLGMGCSTDDGATVEGATVEGATVEIVGYWDQSWETFTPPVDANMAIAFTGEADVDQALADSAKLIDRMVGEKYLGLGGGDETGGWTAARIDAVVQDLDAGKLADYVGVAFDVEVCDEEGLADDFAEAFAAAKRQRLGVLVTISHSEPYGCKDTTTLMKSFLDSAVIDYLSPQLYTSGSETENDYTAVGTPWSAYADTQAAVVPSIVRASMYADAQTYFQEQGVTLGGFVAWRHDAE
ncbi:MAG: hypothetical protein AAF772_12395 [Acidobacteriota bacterium]